MEPLSKSPPPAHVLPATRGLRPHGIRNGASRGFHGTTADRYNTADVFLCATVFFSGMDSCPGVVDRRHSGARQTHGQCHSSGHGVGSTIGFSKLPPGPQSLRLVLAERQPNLVTSAHTDLYPPGPVGVWPG